MPHAGNLTTIARSTEPGALVVGNPGDTLVCQGGTLWKPAPGGSGGPCPPLSSTVYVDKNTTVPAEQQNGSQCAPFATFAAAIAATPDLEGVMIFFEPGDYTGEGPQVCGHRSLQGVNGGSDSFAVRLPAVDFTDAESPPSNTVANVTFTDTISGNSGSLDMFACDVSNITGTTSVFADHCNFNGNFEGQQFVARDSSVGYSTISIAGNLDVEFSNCGIGNLTTIDFSAPGGTVLLDALSAFSYHALQPAVTNGRSLVRADTGSAILTVAVPTLVANTLGYANVDTTGTELDGISVDDVVVANPTSDLAAAGANDGGYLNCRVSTVNTIRLAFLGALAGGNASFLFARVSRVIPPPG